MTDQSPTQQGCFLFVFHTNFKDKHQRSCPARRARRKQPSSLRGCELLWVAVSRCESLVDPIKVSQNQEVCRPLTSEPQTCEETRTCRSRSCSGTEPNHCCVNTKRQVYTLDYTLYIVNWTETIYKKNKKNLYKQLNKCLVSLVHWCKLSQFAAWSD